MGLKLADWCLSSRSYTKKCFEIQSALAKQSNRQVIRRFVDFKELKNSSDGNFVDGGGFSKTTACNNEK